MMNVSFFFKKNIRKKSKCRITANINFLFRVEIKRKSGLILCIRHFQVRIILVLSQTYYYSLWTSECIKKCQQKIMQFLLIKDLEIVQNHLSQQWKNNHLCMQQNSSFFESRKERTFFNLTWANAALNCSSNSERSLMLNCSTS